MARDVMLSFRSQAHEAGYLAWLADRRAKSARKKANRSETARVMFIYAAAHMPQDWEPDGDKKVKEWERAFAPAD